MRTDNFKKLLTATVNVTNPSSSTYYGNVTPLSGKFVQVDGTERESSEIRTQYTSNGAAQVGTLAKIMCLTVPRDLTTASGDFGPEYKSWTAVKAVWYTINYEFLPRYVSATYDATDTPISSSDYEMKGVDVEASISSQNNGSITVTFSNAGSDTLHANRIGISGTIYYRPTLFHIFAFDDIALAPGETKSITIQPDLD